MFETLEEWGAAMLAEHKAKARELATPWWAVFNARGACVAVRSAVRLKRGEYAVEMRRVAPGHFVKVPNGREMHFAGSGYRALLGGDDGK